MIKQKVVLTYILIGLLSFSNPLLAAVDILIIGSSHSYSEGAESGVVHQKPFNPTTIASRLQSILSGDAAIGQTVNVQFEDIYKTKTLVTPVGAGGSPWTLDYHCYSLMQHFMWPENKTTRLANLRGEGSFAWDYIILCEDPYVMAHFPGTYAEAVKIIQSEIAKSANPAQLVLLAQWPDSTSTFTATNFNEIAYRVGNSGGITVVPAGKAWNSYTSKDTSTAHPTPKGQYLAAAAIYSKLYNRNAKTSSYVYPSDGSNIADLALSVIQSNNGIAQYTGKYTTANAFQMEYYQGRQVDWNEYGSSTEEGFANGFYDAFTYAKVNNLRRNPPATGNPVHISYSRGNDNFEPEKQYQVNAAMHNRVHGFPMGDHKGATDTEAGELTMRYGIDKRYFSGASFENGTDLGIAYSMVREGEIPQNVRGIPVRLLWSKIQNFDSTIPSHDDGWHLGQPLNRAVGAFLYTSMSGRCPVEPEPAVSQTSTVWRYWWCRKLGYETAWQMAHLTTRAPGFKVSPSSASALTITPTTKETMTVEFVNPPQSNVTVNVSISNSNAAIVGSTQLVFTPQNYITPQSVSIAGLPGSAASESFNVVYTTVSTDEIYNNLSDSWAYTINRSTPVTLTRVNKATIQKTAYQNLPVTINLNTTGASSTNTIIAGPSGGVTSWSGSNVIYTPSSDFTGKDGFTFATNNAGTLSVGYVDITVAASVPSGMVSYRGNGNSGGAVPVDSNTYAQSATVTILGNTGNLTRVGYNFAGWNTAANGSGTNYNAGSTFLMGASGVILYAKWTTAPTYTVTYNGNTNNGGIVPSNQIKTNGVNLTLASNIGALTKNGYTFSGWNTLANGTGTQYAAGAAYSDNANVTLYAKWTPSNYTVTFNANGGTTPNPTSKVVTYTSTYGDLATTTRSGYTFKGWFTSATNTSQILPTTTVNITSALTLYAQWILIPSSAVSYDANGATAGTVPADQTKLQDVTLTLATNTGNLTRTGYTFAGWNTAANSSGTPYAAGASYTINAPVILYAQWAGTATYTISYNSNSNTGGSIPSNQIKSQGVGISLATNSGNLTRTGYSFTGWNTAANGSGNSYAAGATYTADANLTLYAQWNTNPIVNAGSDKSITLGASVPWMPTALSPQLWLDGSTATNNAGTVSITNTGSGGGNVSGPAAIVAGGIGTLQAVQFNGSSQYLAGNYTNKGTTLTAFFVGKSLNSTQIAHTGMMDIWENGQASDYNNVGSAVIFGQNYNTANSIYAYRKSAGLSSATGTLTSPFIAATVFDGAANTLYLNGTASSSVASTGNFSADNVTLGARRHSSVINSWWNGNFGETIICNANLNANDRQKVEGYLAHKWGLAGNLAAGHPHKTAPPELTGAVATLNGTATDTDALTYAWSVVSGPASVTFTDITAIDTTANFTGAGVYTLRLTANDGLAQVSDDIVVTVSAPGSNHSVTYNGNGNTGGAAPIDASSPYTNGSKVTVLGNTSPLTRTGYTFNNWNTAANGSGTSYAAGNTFNISANTTLYAQWTINPYTITFNSAGGSAVTAITQNYGTTVTAPANPTRSGYTFTGWSPALPSTIPANNLSVNAQWTINSYTITFNSAGGSAVTAITQNFGTSITAPTPPTHSGYTFTGWSPALPSTMPASSQTVTAQWNAIPVVNTGSDQTVYLTQSTTWSPSTLTPQLWLDANDTNTITLNGTTVSQWNDKSNFGRHATQSTSTAQPTTTAAGLNGKRVITFDGNSDALNVNLDFLAGTSHSAFIVTKPTIYNNIYGAANGSQGANSLHVGFASAGNYRMNYWTNDFSPTISSNFIPSSANIMNYNWLLGISKQILANGKSEGISTSPAPGTIGTMSGGGRIGNVVGQGFFGGDIAEVIIVTGSISTEDRQKMEAYLAHKWGLAANLAADHPYKTAAPGDSTAVATLDATATDADAITTTWSVVSGPGTVTFANANAIDTTSTFNVAGTYTLRLTANDGYSSVSDDVVITVNTTSPLRSITYDGNGNTGGAAPIDASSPYTNSSTVTVLGNTSPLTRTGYTFNNWNIAANGSGTSYAAGNTFNISANTTLYAQWTINPYTITFNSAGGSAVTAITQNYGTTVTAPANPTRSGYTFTGWSPALPSTIPANNLSVTAQWTINSYTITFNSAGGSAVTAITQNFGTSITAPTPPTHSGYTFTGWSPALPSTMPASSQTVTAQWNAIPVVNTGSDQTVYLTQSTTWSPSTLTPQLWLDADDTNSITLNGATVSQWNDKSTFGRHATQSTSTAQPTATAAGLNGKRVITFDGNSDALNVNLDFLAGTSHSAFIVTKPTIYNNIYGATNGKQGANSLHVGFASAGNYRMNYWANDFSPTISSNFIPGSANIMNYNWLLGISKQILANGKSEGISTSPAPGTIGTMSGGGRIGNVVGQGFFGGDIAEVIIVTGSISTEDRQKMEAYLAHKWGLAANLAADHPYKTAAPGDSTAVATLDATATDADAITTTWSVVSGPGTVTFANANAIDTTSTFNVAGTYTLRLTANDGYSSVSDDVVITVNTTSPLRSIAYDGNGNTTEAVLPLPWTSVDIGTNMLDGSITHNAGTFTQAGSGAIGGTSDKLRFTYQTLTGDGEIIAKISDLENTGSSSRVGIMIRDSLASNSKQIFMGMSGSNAYRWVRRTTTSGNTSTSASSTGTIPNTWVRLVRSGNTITAYKSANGSTWTQVGSTTNTTFSSTCYIGLAVSSGSNTTLNTSKFSNVNVTP